LQILKLVTSDTLGSAESPDGGALPSDKYFAVLRAIHDLVDAVGTENRLLLIVEDAHWADALSLEILTDLIVRDDSRRLLLVATAREAHQAFRRPNVDALIEIHVSGLDAVALADLTHALARTRRIEVDDALQVWFVQTAGGNPLFLESLVGHYASSRQRFVVPLSLGALLRKRIDLVSPSAVVTLQLIALLGRHATIRRIERASELNRIDLLSALGELERARLVLLRDGLAQPGHGLVAEQVVARMQPIERRLAHQCIAIALERDRDNDCDGTVIWDCAEHWLAAGDVERSCAAARRCAQHALKLGRPQAAAEMLLRAAEQRELDAAERLELGRQAVMLGDLSGNHCHVFRALHLLRSHESDHVHDDIELAEVRAQFRSTADTGDLCLRLLECVRATSASADHRLAAAISLMKISDSTANDQLGREISTLLEEAALTDASRVLSLEYELICACAREDMCAATQIATAWVDSSRSLAPSVLAVTLRNAGVAAFRAGALETALKWTVESYQISTQTGSIFHQLYDSLLMAEILHELKRDDEARDWDQVADRLVGEFPSIADHPTYVWQRLTRLVQAGDGPRSSQMLAAAEAIGLFAASPVRERWLRVFTTRISLLRGIVCGPTAAKLLACEAIEHRTHSALQDLEISTCCRALVALGRQADAQAEFRRYWEIRKTRASYACRELSELGEVLQAFE
jgi:tetratricopeptide (TPR) repeat protein